MVCVVHFQNQATPLLLIIFIQLVQQVISKASPSPYTSITKLDKYGSSAQIKNAQVASQLYGVTTIAAIATASSPAIDSEKGSNNHEELIVVVSRERKSPGVLTKHNKLHVLSKDPSRSSTTAMVGSGLRSDVTFLSHILRRHASNHWERYDNIPDAHRMAFGAGQVMQAFHGYDRSREVGDGVPDVLLDYEGDGKRMSIGRPLAASLLLVDVVSGVGSDPSKATMLAVDPSGVVSGPLIAFGIGRDREKVNEMLRCRYRYGMGIEEIEKMCIGILHHVAGLEDDKNRKGEASDGSIVTTDQKAEKGSENDDEVEHIVCEILSKDGLSVKRILVKEGQLLYSKTYSSYENGNR